MTVKQENYWKLMGFFSKKVLSKAIDRDQKVSNNVVMILIFHGFIIPYVMERIKCCQRLKLICADYI